MGRVGENWLRAIQTADAMKRGRGKLPEDAPGNDNFRVLRYVAKVTINPAMTFGIGHVLGSISPGKMADLVLWEPAFFGAKPKLVIKGGLDQLGATWATRTPRCRRPQPVMYRPMFGAFGSALTRDVVHLRLARPPTTSASPSGSTCRRIVMPVYGTRTVTKRDMVRNAATPKIEVDPETFAVKVDGVHATVDPIESIALNQLYFFS